MNKKLWREHKERNLKPRQPLVIEREVAQLVLGAIVFIAIWLGITFVMNAGESGESVPEPAPVSVALNR